MTRNDINEANIVRQGLASIALQDEATTGQVPIIQEDGSVAYGDAGGGSQPYDPTAVDGLVVWLDASQIEGLSDGDPVASWDDLSGEGNDAVQATADNQPVYKTAVQNGKAVVRFDPSENGQVLALPVSLLRAATGFTIALVTDPTLSPTGTVVAFFNTGAGNTFGNISIGSASSDLQMQVAAQALNTYAAGSGVGWAAHAARYAADQMLAYAVSGDGPAGGDQNNVAHGALPDSDWDFFNVGGDLVNPSAAYTGDIAEVLIWDRALNAAETRELMEYLSDKWNVL